LSFTIVAANRGEYPDLVDGKPGKGPQVSTPSYVCLNDRKGHFPVCQPLPTESATSIVAADFDGDSALDLLVPHRDGGHSVVLWNDGKGTSRPRPRWGQPKRGFSWARLAISTAMGGPIWRSSMNVSRLPSSSLIEADAGSENRSGFPAPSGRRTAWRSPT
jgi:hypothetical protein